MSDRAPVHEPSSAAEPRQPGAPGPRPLRVLHTVRSLRIDGIVRVVQRTLPELDRGGVVSTVAAMRADAALDHEFRQAGIEPYIVRHRTGRDTPRSVARLVRLIRDQRIDLVHVNQTLDLFLAGTAARLAGVPVVATIHWLGDGPRYDVRGRVRTESLKGLLRVAGDRLLADEVVTVSEAVRRAHVRRYGRLFPDARVRTIHPGLDMTIVPDRGRDAVRSELGVAPGTPLLLNVGRLHPIKGQRHLLPMMLKVRRASPNAVLLVAGDGPLRPALEREIEGLGLSGAIRLLGSRTDVDELMVAADIIILSSESEAAPLPVLEAARASRATVATAVGGACELAVDGETAFLVPPGDPSAWADAVLRLLNDPGLAVEIGARARRYAQQRFDLPVMARWLGELYRELVDVGGAAPL